MLPSSETALPNQRRRKSRERRSGVRSTATPRRKARRPGRSVSPARSSTGGPNWSLNSRAPLAVPTPGCASFAHASVGTDRSTRRTRFPRLEELVVVRGARCLLEQTARAATVVVQVDSALVRVLDDPLRELERLVDD